MVKIDYKLAGQNIRRQRKIMKYTQAQIAEKAEIDTAYLSHIENGTRKAGIQTLVNIANVLNVTLDYIINNSLGEEGEEQAMRILNRVKKLPKKDRNLVEMIIDAIERLV